MRDCNTPRPIARTSVRVSPRGATSNPGNGPRLIPSVTRADGDTRNADKPAAISVCRCSHRA
jgi:hypothetical protein